MFDVWSGGFAAKMEKRIKELESENEKRKNIRRQDGKMKTITLQVEDVDQVIVDELKDAYLRNNKFDRVDCSDTVLEPDYELLKAIQTVLEYYMTAEEIELWNDYEKGE